MRANERVFFTLVKYQNGRNIECFSYHVLIRRLIVLYKCSGSTFIYTATFLLIFFLLSFFLCMPITCILATCIGYDQFFFLIMLLLSKERRIINGDIVNFTDLSLYGVFGVRSVFISVKAREDDALGPK